MQILNLTELLETFGDSAVLAVGGLGIGLLFGYSAQRARFCMRAAVIEFWQRQFAEKLSVWLLCFSSAVLAVQALIYFGALDISASRQIANRGSLSGALIGGLMFGSGMIMTRGCASRLLILSAGGNLRALLSGLIFAVAAQSALNGALSPLRLSISQWWTVEGGDSRDLLNLLGAGHGGGVLAGLIWLLAAIYFATRQRHSKRMWLGSIGTGLCVAIGWLFTYSVAHDSFQVVAIQGLTFSGPSAEWLMRVLSSPPPAVGFDSGFLPGVFGGAFLGAWLNRELKLEGFTDGYSMRRYIAGAVLMGFGAMSAGGCAVGAGVSGGAIFSLTAWITLAGMWLGAGLTDRLLDHAPEEFKGPLGSQLLAP